MGGPAKTGLVVDTFFWRSLLTGFVFALRVGQSRLSRSCVSSGAQEEEGVGNGEGVSGAGIRHSGDVFITSVSEKDRSVKQRVKSSISEMRTCLFQKEQAKQFNGIHK